MVCIERKRPLIVQNKPKWSRVYASDNWRYLFSSLNNLQTARPTWRTASFLPRSIWYISFNLQMYSVHIYKACIANFNNSLLRETSKNRNSTCLDRRDHPGPNQFVYCHACADRVDACTAVFGLLVDDHFTLRIALWKTHERLPTEQLVNS